MAEHGDCAEGIPQQRASLGQQKCQEPRKASPTTPWCVAGAPQQLESRDAIVTDRIAPHMQCVQLDLVAARHQPGRVIEHEGLRSRGELRHRERDAHQCWSFGGGVRSSDSAKW